MIRISMNFDILLTLQIYQLFVITSKKLFEKEK